MNDPNQTQEVNKGAERFLRRKDFIGEGGVRRVMDVGRENDENSIY